MVRKSLTLTFTLFAALLLLGMQKPCQANQSFGANCLLGSGSAWVRVYAYGAFVNGAPAGRIYFGLPNGLNSTVLLSTLSFTTLPDGEMQATGSGTGYLFSAGTPIAWVQVTGTFTYNPGTGAKNIEIVVSSQRGTPYFFDSGALPIMMGQEVITSN